MSVPSLFAICTIGSAVEFCWAAGEAVLVPFLVKHGVPQWIVSTIYLANPTLGLWVQPRLGAWSDRINRRVPFVVALSLIALAGIATLLSAIPLTRALGFRAIDDGDDSIPRAAIVMTFLGFGAADICFDCLLIPGRSLLHDRAAAALSSSSSGDELFTGFQLGGRLLALLVGSSSWKVGNSSDAHFNACFIAGAAVLTSSALVVSCFVDDRGSTYAVPGDAESDRPTRSNALEDERRNTLQSPSPPTILNCDDNEARIRNIAPDESLSQPNCHCKTDASVLLCAVQAAGWVGICAQSFFWTSWRGEEVGCIDLALQGAVGMITAALLPLANAHFGAASVWCGSELFFHLLMVSVGLTSRRGNAPRFVSALSGINYAVHATNGLIVATDVIPDPTRRARTIAMVNNALPMGQLITALSGGAIAQYFGGGFEVVFVCYGLFGGLVTFIVWVISSEQGLFSKR